MGEDKAKRCSCAGFWRRGAAGLAAVLVGAALLFGCNKTSNEKLPLPGVAVEVPRLGEGQVTTSSIKLATGAVQETVILRQAPLKTAESYIDWFQKDGWTVMKENHDVTAFSYIFTKDNVGLVLGYSQKTLTMQFSRR